MWRPFLSEGSSKVSHGEGPETGFGEYHGPALLRGGNLKGYIL